MSTKKQKIEEKFSRSQDALVLQQSDLSLQSIADMVKSGAIDISPKYQRRERWTPEKESGLIESFLLNIPVPPIYLAEDEYGTYSVIDGKQRVTAIEKFLRGGLILSGMDKFEEVEGATINSLPAPLVNALKIRPYLRVVTLLRQSDPDLKHEVFLRLNKAGVALNSQEIRNVAFRGAFNDMLFELSEDEYLTEQLKATKNSKVYREMTDVQYVLRFFTVRAYWADFYGNMDSAMDKFMAGNYRAKRAKIKECEHAFAMAIDFCKRVWGDDGFKKPNGNSRVLQGFYDVQMVCSSLLTDAERKRAVARKDDVKSGLEELLLQDSDFSESVSQFTSNPRNVHYRISTFTDFLRSL